MRKLLLVLVLVALSGYAAVMPAQAAGCGCKRCAVKSKSSCGCKAKCACTPSFCPAGGVSGFHTDCVDGCCPPKAGVEEVCVGSWDLCKKWADGKVHHPYEQAHSGSGMLCDTGCGAYIPCKRRGITCRTLSKEHTCTDNCGCKHVSYSTETVCDELMRPRTRPWWFNPGHGNVYLDEQGNPVCEPAAAPAPAPEAAPTPAPRPEPTPAPQPAPAPAPQPAPEAAPEPAPEVIETVGRG